MSNLTPSALVVLAIITDAPAIPENEIRTRAKAAFPGKFRADPCFPGRELDQLTGAGLIVVWEDDNATANGLGYARCTL